MKEDSLRAWLLAELNSYGPDDEPHLDGYELGQYHAFKQALEKLEGGTA